MPPQRSKVSPLQLFVGTDAHVSLQLRRTATLTGSFYDKSGAIGESALPSPTATSFRERARDVDMMSDTASTRGGGAGDDDSDDEYCLTGYGEMSTDEPFTLPPSPTQTIKYRYRAYRPKLADRKSTRLNSSHSGESRMPSSA